MIGSLASRVEATEPLRTELPLILTVGICTLGDGAGESAAPSISALPGLGLRGLDGAGLR